MHICLIAIKVKSGTIWQTIPQIKGEEGESAYEIAVRNGFEGTEEEWLEYLRQGPKGDDGLPGKPGDNYQFIFKRTDSSNAPLTPESATDAIPVGWSGVPLGVTVIAKYEWVSIRIKKDNVWSVFSAPALWAIYGFGDSLPDIYIEDVENLQDVLDDLQNQIDGKISKSLLPDPNTVKLPGADIYGVVLPKYLPIATANSLGAIKVGSTLSINSETGVLNTNIGFRNLIDGALDAEPKEGASIVWNSTSKKYVNTILSLSGTYHPYLGKDAQGNKYDLWAKILRPDTLILPQTPPVVSNNEVAIYGLENGYTIVEPDPVDNKLLGDLEDVTIGTLAQYDSIFRVGNEFINLPAYTKSQINALFTGADGKYHPLYGKNTIDFIAKTLRSVNLVIPQSIPNFSPTEVADGEVALYARESGYTIEDPGDYVTQFTELTDVASLAWTSGETLVFKNNAFSNYPIYTKTEVDTLIQNVGIDGYYDKDYIDSHFHPILGLHLVTQLPLNFNADVLKSNTLLLSKALPTIANDEIALYAAENGYSIATPETSPVTLEELIDVNLIESSDKQALLYNIANQSWENTSLNFDMIGGNLNANRITQSELLKFVSNSQITAWDAKWNFDANTIKAIEVNNAINSSKLGGQLPSFYATAEELSLHISDTDNPHNVTIEQIGAAPETGSANYIQNQLVSAQTADYWISGKAKSGILIVPTNTPIISNSEVAIFAKENGYTIATPEESPVTLSALLDVDLNNEQTSDVLSYSSILQSWVNSPITFNTIVGDLDPARISQSETYRFVTDAEKILWTAKQSKLIGTQDSSNGSLVRVNTLGAVDYDNTSYATVSQLSGYALTSHNHSYAGSATVGGAATSANAVNVVSGNEINFGGNFIGSTLFINWNDGGNIGEYAFYDGGVSLANVSALKFYENGTTLSSKYAAINGSTSQPFSASNLLATYIGINTTTLTERLNVNGYIALQYGAVQKWHYGVNSSNNLVFSRSGIADIFTLADSGAATFASSIDMNGALTGATTFESKSGNIKNNDAWQTNFQIVNTSSGVTYQFLVGGSGNTNMGVGNFCLYGPSGNNLIINQSGAATFSSTISALGGNSTQWNTAYGWGNHASAGYALASSLSNYSLTSHTHSYITSTRYDSGDPKPNQLTVGLSFQFSYPDGGWYNAINMRSYNDPNYLATQIVSSANNPGLDTGYGYSLKYREGRNATWLDWKTILDSSNYSSYALPLSGGTLSDSIKFGYAGGTMLWSNSFADMLGWNPNYGTYIGSNVNGYNEFIYGNGKFFSGGNLYTLIHSGNIGSQSVNYATSASRLRSVGTSTSMDLNTHLAGGGIVGNYGSGGYWVNGPSGMSYGSVIQFDPAQSSSILSLQLAFDVNHHNTSSTKSLWFRTSNDLGFQNDWKEIYHTGNLTKTLSNGYLPSWNNGSLANSPISTDGANISIIRTVYATGALVSNIETYSTYPSNYLISAIRTYNKDDFWQGELAFFTTTYGTANSLTEAMRIHYKQNVSIGYTTDQGYKLAVNGSGYFATTLQAGTSITAPTVTASTALVLNGHTLTIE